MNNIKMNDKTCKNCKYVRQHYSVFDGMFSPVPNAFHCAHRDKVRKSVFDNCVKNNVACKYWEQYEIRKEEIKRDIKNILIRLSKQLDNVIQVLENIEPDGND